MADIEGKKLTELRVIDLKTELERRGLDKTGNKAALLDRLAKAIVEEGNDPDDYLIVPSGGVRASPKKPVIDTSITIEDVLETEVQKNEFDNTIDSSEQPSVNADDDNNANIVEDTDNTIDNSENTIDNDEPIINISAHPEELEMEYQETEQEPTVTTTSEEPPPEKETFIAPDESSNVSAVETNGIDNEDSINLTIGEDEENLLAEETELNERPKADGGAKKSSEESDNLSLGSSNNNSNDDSNINKKGDSKGSGRAEVGASSSSNSSGGNKEGISASSSTSTSASGVNNATSLKNKTDGEGSKSGEATAKGSKKDEKVSPNASSRNLWVSGLSSSTRATDLKQIFSKYGKVIGAKVVTNARTPGSRCYGYVTMSTSDDAEKCIEHLHRTELHGRVISVEKAKGDSQQSHNRKREATNKADKKDDKDKGKDAESEDKEAAEKNEEDSEDRGKKKDDESSKETDEKVTEDSTGEREKRENSLENKDEGSLKDCDTRSNKSSSKKSDRERGNSREDKKRSWDRSRTSRSKSRERPRRDNVLSFDKIKEERERQRQREKERLVREEKRRRREDMERQRAIEREAARLEREREKLRLERERIEQEKAELLRLERERQKVEREKLERERLELKRQQMRLEENNRRGGPPGSSGSPAAGIKRTTGDRPRETYAEPERKRINADHPSRRHSPERVPDNRRMDSASVAGRYENTRAKETVPMHKNFKRTDFAARNHRSDDQYEMSNRQGIRRDAPRPNQNSMDHRPPKDRYERPSSGFGRDREVHRSDDNHRASRDNHSRYDNSKPNNPRDGRYVENNRQTGWHSGPPSKPFNSVNNRNEQSGWNDRSSDSRMNNSRWNTNMGNNMGGGHPRSQMYQGGGGGGGGGPQSYTHPQGNSGSYNRFDPYKGSMQNMRKY